jgi:hypothetical protein
VRELPRLAADVRQTTDDDLRLLGRDLRAERLDRACDERAEVDRHRDLGARRDPEDLEQIVRVSVSLFAQSTRCEENLTSPTRRVEARPRARRSSLLGAPPRAAPGPFRPPAATNVRPP